MLKLSQQKELKYRHFIQVSDNKGPLVHQNTFSCATSLETGNSEQLI